VPGPSSSAARAATASAAAARTFAFPLALAVALLVVRAGDASAALYRSDDEIARHSAAAVRGRVVSLRSGWDTDAGAIYTLVTLDVTRSWGLPGAPARVEVKQLGGVVGDTALVVGGQARFVPGEDVLVFLDVRPRDGTLSVAGLDAGKWTITSGVAARTRSDATTATADRLADPVAAPDTRSLAAIEALAALAGTRVRIPALRASGALIAADPGHVAQPHFSLLAPATPARWHEADTRTPVYVDTQPGGHPQIPGGGLVEAIAATTLWSAPAALVLRPGGFRGPRCFAHGEAADGRISLTYGDPCGEIADDSATLAIGGAYYSASDVRVVSGVPIWKITAGMIVTDGVPAKFAGMSLGCYADLVAHELGHAIGFGHAATAASLMFPTLPAGCAARSTGTPLHAADLAGLSVLYPMPGPPPPGVPNGLGAAVSGDVVTVFWGVPLWGPAPTSYRLEAGSAPGLSDRGIIDVSGTAFVSTRVGNGVYFVRVRALAGGVPGAATPDVAITVGGPPPGPPTAVTAALGPGGSVLVTWSPPDTGTVTGYVVQVGYGAGHTAHQFAVTQPSIASAGVPPGTYVLRVVAMNGTADGPPSSEVTLVVP
jgi:hypothetical protein